MFFYLLSSMNRSKMFCVHALTGVHIYKLEKSDYDIEVRKLKGIENCEKT